MANHHTIKLLEQRGLHPRVTEQLTEAADRASAQGVSLVVFGSFARGKNRPGSDLDVGLVWQRRHDPAIAGKIARTLEDLPTVRQIDVVDFYEVSADFRRQAMRQALEL